MRNYLELLESILSRGTVKPNRTGVLAKSLTGQTLTFENIAAEFPLVTTRKIPFRLVFEETMMFLCGKTQTKDALESKNILIWQKNTSRSFLDSRGLKHLAVGDMGLGYGHQIRNFGSSGYDQLEALLVGLKLNPCDRRHVVTHWCPPELDQAALPPCHLLHMYSVDTANGVSYLDSSFVMRSSDAFHGLPFNIASYALINHLIAECCGFVPRKLVYFGHDVHIYDSHRAAVETLLTRTPRRPGTLLLKKSLYRESVAETLKQLESLTIDDVEVAGYTCCDAIKVDMVV